MKRILIVVLLSVVMIGCRTKPPQRQLPRYQKPKYRIAQEVLKKDWFYVPLSQ